MHPSALLRYCGLLAVVALWAGVTLPAPALASAPARLAPKDAREAYANSALVFQAKVEKVYNDTLGFPSSADVRVTRTWKGALPQNGLLKIDGKGGPTYPARIFKLGETYLFYIDQAPPGAELRADSYMHRVLPLDAAADDIKLLRALPGK